MSRYRLYIDESGDHTFQPSAEIGRRYLAVVGAAVNLDGEEVEALRVRFEQLKQRHLTYDPDDPPILHREDIVEGSKAFWRLREAARRDAFDLDLLSQIEASDFRLFAVVLDKVTHQDRDYRMLRHPYHYCLHALLESYCGWLRFAGHTGDVMAESRGGAEDRALKTAYSGAYDDGTCYMTGQVAQLALTTREIKLKPKRQNIAGLQLADLLAHS